MDFVDYTCLESLIIEGENLIATEGFFSNIWTFIKNIIKGIIKGLKSLGKWIWGIITGLGKKKAIPKEKAAAEASKKSNQNLASKKEEFTQTKQKVASSINNRHEEAGKQIKDSLNNIYNPKADTGKSDDEEMNDLNKELDKMLGSKGPDSIVAEVTAVDISKLADKNFEIYTKEIDFLLQDILDDIDVVVGGARVLITKLRSQEVEGLEQYCNEMDDDLSGLKDDTSKLADTSTDLLMKYSIPLYFTESQRDSILKDLKGYTKEIEDIKKSCEAMLKFIDDPSSNDEMPYDSFQLMKKRITITQFNNKPYTYSFEEVKRNKDNAKYLAQVQKVLNGILSELPKVLNVLSKEGTRLLEAFIVE